MKLAGKIPALPGTLQKWHSLEPFCYCGPSPPKREKPRPWRWKKCWPPPPAPFPPCWRRNSARKRPPAKSWRRKAASTPCSSRRTAGPSPGSTKTATTTSAWSSPPACGGTTFFGGWRRGLGDYPVYEGKSLTATDGEARVGVSVPLWRNGSIDRRRASLTQAELGELIAGHEYDQALIELRRAVAHRYWDWVLAGRRLRVAEAMLDIAERRDAGIRRRVAAGDIAEFEAADNQRAILERRERQVAARRLLEQAAIQLSLYWRDEQGQPQLPEAGRLPAGFPSLEPVQPADFAAALETAQASRPEPQRLDLQHRQTETELELQRNQQAPGLDFSVMGARDIGPGKDKLNREELYLGLNVDIPLQRRVAGGRAQVAGANLQRLKLERQLADDRIAAEVRDALSALDAARQRLELAGRQRQAAQRLEQGERTRFELGDSTLLFVNLREIAGGDAALMEAEAAAALFKSHADYQAALGVHGEDGHRPEPAQK